MRREVMPFDCDFSQPDRTGADGAIVSIVLLRMLHPQHQRSSIVGCVRRVPRSRALFRYAGEKVLDHGQRPQ